MGQSIVREVANDTPRKAAARAEAAQAEHRKIADQKAAQLAEVEPQYRDSSIAISKAVRVG
jgi:hypothetical protein